MRLYASIVNLSVLYLFNLESSGIRDVHGCKSHEKEEAEYVLFVFRQLAGMEKSDEHLKFFFREINHKGVCGRQAVCLKWIHFYFTGPHGSVIVHAYHAHVFAYRAWVVVVGVSEICGVYP